jgi:DNA-binding CsgD family transcriptional regulator
MTRRPNLTAAEKEYAAERREHGWSHDRIAKVLCCSPGAVAWHCLAMGADPPNAKPINKTIKGPLRYMRSGKPVRRFTAIDDQELLALSLAGKTHSQIAKVMGRQPKSIRGRLMMLARQEARPEKALPLLSRSTA